MHPGLSLSALEPGTLVDRFRIIRRLAVGGMAELYLADATGIEGFEKRVVLKRILPQYACRPEFVGMFLDEARLAATLHHPNIAQVYDIGIDGESYYFTMEYVEGRDVRHVRKRAAKLEQDIPLDHTINIALGVAGGLHAAHEQRGADGVPLGIVHRDVSPANVIVTWDGYVKLIDFGIAKAARRQTQTRTGILKGKSCNMSPEQCLAEPLDRRSDVFSLGIMLYELSTGTRLFRTDSEFETMRLIVDGVYEPPSTRRPEYPPQLERIVMRALERDPGDRFQSAHEMFVELDCFAREERLAVAPYHLAGYLGELFPMPGDARGSESSPPLFLLGDEADISDVIDVRKSESATVDGTIERAATVTFPPPEPVGGRRRRRSSPARVARGSAPRDRDADRDSVPETAEMGIDRFAAPVAVPDDDDDEARDTIDLARRVPTATGTDTSALEPPESPTSLVNVRDGRAASAPLFASNLSILALCASLAVAAAVIVFGLFAEDGWFAQAGGRASATPSPAPAAMPVAARGGAPETTAPAVPEATVVVPAVPDESADADHAGHAEPAKPAAKPETAPPASRPARKPAVREEPKPAPRKPAARKAAAAKPAPAKPAPAKPAPVKPEAAKPEAAKPAAVKPAADEADAAKPEANKPEPAKPAADKAEPKPAAKPKPKPAPPPAAAPAPKPKAKAKADATATDPAVKPAGLQGD